MKTECEAKTVRRLKSGFTVLELSVVLIIISLMVGSTLILGNVRIEQEKVESTKSRIALIEKALISYGEINQRLPCPSYPTYKSGDAMFGVESATPGNCRTGTPNTTWFTSDSAIGSVPAATLGLPSDAMYDAWGRRFTYVVYIPMTAEKALNYNSSDSSCGGLQIANDSGSVSVPNAIFVILSHGADGHGAFSSAGIRIDAKITNSSARINANTNSDFDADSSTISNIYRSQSYFEDSSNPFNRFDDVIVYRTRKNFILPSDAKLRNFSVNNNLSATGWMYVPEYTLPSGKVVPAFEVMKYLASDDGTGIPLSKPLTAPWTGQSYANARMACQKLDGYSATSTLTGDGNALQYDIISETQWISLAHQVSDDSRNWVDGCYGNTGMIAGHRDNSPSSVLAASDNDENGYYLTSNSADASVTAGNSTYKRSQRRTFYLPSGGVMWDLSGNTTQWSYCDLKYAKGENQYYAAARKSASLADNGYNLCRPSGQTNMATYFDNFAPEQDISQHYWNYSNCILPTSEHGKFVDMMPKNNFSTIIGEPDTRQHYVGNFSTPSLANSGGLVRGSDYQTALYGGVFRVRIGETPTGARHGFRCVRTLAPKTVSPDNFAGLEIWYDASDLDGNNIVAGTSEAGLIPVATCTKTAGEEKYNGCVDTWRNKAIIPPATSATTHLRSMRKNGAADASVNDDPRPTYKLSGINGMPAVNFNRVRQQYMDTHHGTALGGDIGNGYNMNTKSTLTIFIVASGSNFSGILSANASTINWPYTMVFPYNINEAGSTNSDYVFLTPNTMTGNDSGNTFCRLTKPASGCAASSNRDYGCAQMGGINIKDGLTPYSTAIISGVFAPGIDNGLAAYVNGSNFLSGTSSNNMGTSVSVTAGQLLGNACGGNMMLMVGGHRGAQAATSANADVSEILIYNRALNASDRRKIEEYLSKKYNIPLKAMK